MKNLITLYNNNIIIAHSHVYKCQSRSGKACGVRCFGLSISIVWGNLPFSVRFIEAPHIPLPHTYIHHSQILI